MITLVGGIKGGTGKSTIATNLAVARASFGLKTLLVDADEQKSATDWANQRTDYFKNKHCDNEVTTISLSGRNLCVEVNKLVKDYDAIIIDAGGRNTTSLRSALMIAHMFVVPFKPRSFDVWTLPELRAMFEDAQALNPHLKACAVINQADHRGTDNDSAKEILLEIAAFKGKVCFIGNRKAFSNAATDGLSVCELDNETKAADEIMTLYHTIYE